jgi:transposase
MGGLLMKQYPLGSQQPESGEDMSRRKDTMDIREIVRRVRAGQSNAAIHREMGIHRRTVARYRAWAEEQGLLEGELPELGDLHRLVAETLEQEPPPQNVSSVEPYRKIVEELRKRQVEIAAIHQRLQERGFEGSYMAVYRFVQRLEPNDPEATVRVEVEPGAEAQVDFGYAGMMVDPTRGKTRKAWLFVMTLAHSRHQYVRFVFDQKVATWLDCHRRAFEYFGGAPRKVTLDNLKAGVVKACVDDPEVQQAYRECAEHYGFLIAPNRVRTPRHKGKVEQGGVHYVKRNFLGGKETLNVRQANRDVLVWCERTAGLRTHGTTRKQPLVVFNEVEKAALQPLPETPFDPGTWKQLTLHRDCHLSFEGSYYSAPFEYIGQQLRVRAGTRHVQVFTQDFRLVATHDRAEEPGTFCTHDDHLPPHLVPGLRLNRDACRAQAETIGPATQEVIAALLDDPVVDRLYTAGRLLRLREQYGSERLENACQRTLDFGDPAYLTVKRILKTGRDQEEAPPAPIQAPPAKAFVRNVVEIVGHLGGISWT